jgi:hypothetical protein
VPAPADGRLPRAATAPRRRATGGAGGTGPTATTAPRDFAGAPRDASPMSKTAPDHHDAELVLKIYDLRREPVMRESRDAINGDFWPRDEKEAVAILAPDHPLNRAYRQTSTYWEMVYGMARHGVVNTEFLLESNGEGLLLFSRIEPYLGKLREVGNPRAFKNAEWIASSCDLAKTIMTTFRARIAKKLGK